MKEVWKDGRAGRSYECKEWRGFCLLKPGCGISFCQHVSERYGDLSTNSFIQEVSGGDFDRVGLRRAPVT